MRSLGSGIWLTGFDGRPGQCQDIRRGGGPPPSGVPHFRRYGAVWDTPVTAFWSCSLARSSPARTASDPRRPPRRRRCGPQPGSTARCPTRPCRSPPGPSRAGQGRSTRPPGRGPDGARDRALHSRHGCRRPRPGPSRATAEAMAAVPTSTAARPTATPAAAIPSPGRGGTSGWARPGCDHDAERSRASPVRHGNDALVILGP